MSKVIMSAPTEPTFVAELAKFWHRDTSDVELLAKGRIAVGGRVLELSRWRCHRRRWQLVDFA